MPYGNKTDQVNDSKLKALSNQLAIGPQDELRRKSASDSKRLVAAAILLPGDRSQAATCASVLAPDPHGNCLGSGGFLLKWGLPGQTSPPWRIAGTFHQVPTLRLMPVTGGRCAGFGHIMFHSQRIAPIRRQAKKWLLRQHFWPPEDDQKSLDIWFVRPEGGNGDGHHPGGGMLACISKLFDAPKLLDGTLGTIIAI